MLDKLRQLAARYDEIEFLLTTPEVASSAARSRALMRERGQLQAKVDRYRDYERVLKERAEVDVLLAAPGDTQLADLARSERDELIRREHELVDELQRLLVDDDPNSGKDAIVEIRAGVGGDEASLFAADLFRMYSRFADRNGFAIEVLSSSQSEVGGLKEIVFALSGPFAYDRLRYESGGHRIQRVPTTETQGRIHTSLATVAVLPEVEDIEVAVKDEDVRIDTFRAGGPGGQNVNKVSSAVRLTHIPSGLVVICQDEASQHKNRAKALRVLRARLYEAEESKRRNERDSARRTMIGSGDRSERIRTYNVPQNRVTDHRLKENYNVDRILDGDLLPLFQDLKKLDIEERLKALS